MKAFLFWARSLFFGLACLLLVVLPARAEVQCGDADTMLRALATKYGEAEVWRGKAVDGSHLLITANPDGTTWTIVGLGPGEQACRLAGGPTWEPGQTIALGEEG